LHIGNNPLWGPPVILHAAARGVHLSEVLFHLATWSSTQLPPTARTSATPLLQGRHPQHLLVPCAPGPKLLAINALLCSASSHAKRHWAGGVRGPPSSGSKLTVSVEPPPSTLSSIPVRAIPDASCSRPPREPSSSKQITGVANNHFPPPRQSRGRPRALLVVASSGWSFSVELPDEPPRYSVEPLFHAKPASPRDHTSTEPFSISQRYLHWATLPEPPQAERRRHTVYVPRVSFIVYPTCRLS
jgi:hypothetical protein